jgi:hypothetical protein
MTIEQMTNRPNHYGVYGYTTDARPIAEFDVVENIRTGETSVVWEYGMYDVPLEILSQANQIFYSEE